MVSYDHYNYPRYWRTRRYEDSAERAIIRRFLRTVTPKRSLIDIGAGYGRLFTTYQNSFKTICLVDPSRQLLSRAKKFLLPDIRLKIISGNADKLPVKGRSYDVALMVRVSHHLSDLEKPLKEIHRVLKPGGHLIFEFANKINCKASLKAIFTRQLSFFSHLPVNLSRHDKDTFFNYHPNQIMTLLSANGFKVITTASISNLRLPIIKKLLPLPVLMALERSLSFFSSRCEIIRFFGPSVFVLARKN